MALRCWKHSRQKTGPPCVGRKGTVVSFPHWEQLVFVSARIGEALLPPPPPPSARLALQALQRLGSFLKPLSAKNICSPAVKTNSAPHSAHFRTLSWYSIQPLSLDPTRKGQRDGRTLHHGPGNMGDTYPGEPEGDPLGLRARSGNRNPNNSALRGLILGSAAPSRDEEGGLVRFAPLLLAQSLPRKRFFGPAFFARLHVEAVLLDFLDDVFLLHLALKTAQGIFQRFTLLDDDFCHCINSPPIRFGLDTVRCSLAAAHR